MFRYYSSAQNRRADLNVSRYQSTCTKWSRIKEDVTFGSETKGEFFISFLFTRESSLQHNSVIREDECTEIFFAFAIPWSLDQHTSCIRNIQNKLNHAYGQITSPITFQRETVCYSLQNRPIEMITITSPSSTASEHLEKPIFVITSRVHPGETPASHMCNGIIDFLLRLKDERAIAAREHFVFKIIPIVNPDGVANGHYRCDTKGVNLNRCYDDPDQDEHPSIFAIKNKILQWNAKGVLSFVIDLHGHANKKGCFAFGNSHSSNEKKAENIAYTKLVAMNCPYFDFNACNFTEKNMISRDRSTTTTKEGSNRVAIFRETGLTHLYTVEANYNGGRAHHRLCLHESAKPLGNTKNTAESTHSNPSDSLNTRKMERNISLEYVEFNEEMFGCMGRSLIIGALDLLEINPSAAVQQKSTLKTILAVRCWARNYVRRK